MKRHTPGWGRLRPSKAEVAFAHKLYQKGENNVGDENERWEIEKGNKETGESMETKETEMEDMVEKVLGSFKDQGVEVEVRTYQQVVEAKGLDPVIVPIADMVDKPLVIYEVRPAQTQFGDALYVKVKIENELWAFFTSGQVLSRKLTEIMDDLPLKATIVRNKRYYDLQ